MKSDPAVVSKGDTLDLTQISPKYAPLSLSLSVCPLTVCLFYCVFIFISCVQSEQRNSQTCHSSVPACLSVPSALHICQSSLSEKVCQLVYLCQQKPIYTEHCVMLTPATKMCLWSTN